MKVSHELIEGGKATVYVNDRAVATLIYMSGLWHWRDRQFANIMVARDFAAASVALK